MDLRLAPDDHRLPGMALATREIPRSEWRGYFDDFSRDLDELRATVEVDGAAVGAQIEAERPLLRGITYDDGDDIVVIGLDASGESGEDLEHIVYKPQTIYLAKRRRRGDGVRHQGCRGNRDARASGVGRISGAAGRGR